MFLLPCIPTVFSVKAVVRFQNLSKENTFSLLIKMKYTRPLTFISDSSWIFQNLKFKNIITENQNSAVWMECNVVSGLSHYLAANF